MVVDAWKWKWSSRRHDRVIVPCLAHAQTLEDEWNETSLLSYSTE